MTADRDKFEIYAANQGLRDFERNEFDDYRNPFTQQPWCFWKASRDALTQCAAEGDDPQAILKAALSVMPNTAEIRSEEQAEDIVAVWRAALASKAQPKGIDPDRLYWLHPDQRKAAAATLNAAQAPAPAHGDDIAVDEFAAAMKAKLADARAKGRHGWQTCSQADLTDMLHEHVAKGDPRDVANFCMFLWKLGHGIKPVSGYSYTESMAYAEGFQRGYAQAPAVKPEPLTDALLKESAEHWHDYGDGPGAEVSRRKAALLAYKAGARFAEWRHGIEAHPPVHPMGDANG